MRSRSALVAYLLGVLLAALSISPAAAEPDRCLRHPRCQRHIQQAAMLSQVGLGAMAIKEYEAAYKIKPAPWILYNIARLFDKLNQASEAVQYYQKYLSKSGDTASPQAQTAAQYIDIYQAWQASHPGEPFRSPADTSATTVPVATQALLAAPTQAPPMSKPRGPSRLSLWLGIATLGTTLVAGIVSSIVIEATAKTDHINPATVPDGWVIAHPFK